MYVCMYVCLYVCMYACTYVSLCLCINDSLHLPGSARHTPGQKFGRRDIAIGNSLLLGILDELKRREVKVKGNE